MGDVGGVAGDGDVLIDGAALGPTGGAAGGEEGGQGEEQGGPRGEPRGHPGGTRHRQQGGTTEQVLKPGIYGLLDKICRW